MSFAYRSLSAKLHERFPQLSAERYTALVGGISVDTEPFVLYGVIFNRFLEETASSSDDSAKKEVALFLEEMTDSEDGMVAFLLNTEVLPTLVKSQTTISSLWPILGSATRHRIRLLPPRLLSKIELPSPE